jgi:hypothetical protein
MKIDRRPAPLQGRICLLFVLAKSQSDWLLPVLAGNSPFKVLLVPPPPEMFLAPHFVAKYWTSS